MEETNVQVLPPPFASFAGRLRKLQAFLAEQPKSYGALTPEEKVFITPIPLGNSNIAFDINDDKIPQNRSIRNNEVFFPFGIAIDLVSVPISGSKSCYANLDQRTFADPVLFTGGTAAQELRAIYSTTAQLTFEGNQIIPRLPMSMFLKVPTMDDNNFAADEYKLYEMALPALHKSKSTVLTIDMQNLINMAIAPTAAVQGVAGTSVYAVRVRVIGVTLLEQDSSNGLALANEFNGNPSLRYLKTSC